MKKPGFTITGRVTDADDKPIVEERLSLQYLTENGQQPPRLPTQMGSIFITDDRGIYRIYGLPAGRYKVSVGQSGSGGIGLPIWGTYVQTYYPDATDISRANPVDLAEGAEAANIDIKVSRRAEARRRHGHHFTPQIHRFDLHLNDLGSRIF